MDSLPDALLLEILNRLDDSADVARCRVASKAFNTVFPGLRSINLCCPNEWYGMRSRYRVSKSKPFKRSRSSKPFYMEVFLDLISKLESVESVCISNELVDEDFAKKWLPRVSESLKSLSLSGLRTYGPKRSSIFVVISKYCHNLINLKLKFEWLSMDNLNPMPMLTSLTLESARLDDENLNELNKCFPNLQVLNLVKVRGLREPEIHFLNLKACHCDVYYDSLSSLTVIAPNLTTLTIECSMRDKILVEAPMLSHFHLVIDAFDQEGKFTLKTFENLKSLLLDSPCLDSLISKFPIMKTVEKLTLEESRKEEPMVRYLRPNLAKVFMVFPNVSSLCIKSGAWLKSEGYWEILDEGMGLKTFGAYLRLVDQSLTFMRVGCVLDQCLGLSKVSLLIHCDVVGSVSGDFMSRCMACWPGLKWRWGIWGEYVEDSWITN